MDDYDPVTELLRRRLTVQLTGRENYEEWSDMIKSVFAPIHALELIDGTYLDPGPGADQRRWTDLNDQAVLILRVTVHHSAWPYLGDRPETAKEVWDRLKETYAPYRTMRTIFSDLLGLSLATCDNNLGKFHAKLRRLNNYAGEFGPEFKLPEPWLVQFFLDRIQPDFHDFTISFIFDHPPEGTRDKPPPTLAFVVRKATEHQEIRRMLAPLARSNDPPNTTPGPSTANTRTAPPQQTRAVPPAAAAPSNGRRPNARSNRWRARRNQRRAAASASH